MLRLSKIIPIRFREEELEALDKMRDSEKLGHLNRSQFIRYLIMKEAKRRNNAGPPRPSEYQSELRNGRPTVTAR